MTKVQLANVFLRLYVYFLKYNILYVIKEHCWCWKIHIMDLLDLSAASSSPVSVLK